MLASALGPPLMGRCNQPIIDALSSHFTLRTLHLNSVYIEEDAIAAFEALLHNVKPNLIFSMNASTTKRQLLWQQS